MKRREWTPPPPVDEAKLEKKEPSLHMFAPLLYAPVLPLLRIGLRGRLPQKQLDQVFFAVVGGALAHAGYIMFSDSSV